MRQLGSRTPMPAVRFEEVESKCGNRLRLSRTMRTTWRIITIISSFESWDCCKWPFEEHYLLPTCSARMKSSIQTWLCYKRNSPFLNNRMLGRCMHILCKPFLSGLGAREEARSARTKCSGFWRQASSLSVCAAFIFPEIAKAKGLEEPLRKVKA